MTTTHLFQIYIRADVEQVFAALTDPQFTRQYFFGTAYTHPPREGEEYLFAMPDGSPAVDGVIEVLEPPHRLVQSWRVRYDDAMAAEPAGRVEWLLRPAGEGLTLLRVVHGDLALSPLTWASVKDGWPVVLDGLKTLLETGTPMPPVTVLEQAPPADVAADWHRAQAVEANNGAWDLLGRVSRGEAAPAGLLRGAYAAAYHWERARGASAATEARARYLIGRAWLASGEPAMALRYGERTLAACRDAGLADVDLAYAHELRTRALLALGRREQAEAEWAQATAVPIADPEDRALVERDFGDVDLPGR